MSKPLQRTIKEQTHLWIRNSETNVYIKAKLASFTVGEGNQLTLQGTRFMNTTIDKNLCCTTISYLQFTKL